MKAKRPTHPLRDGLLALLGALCIAPAALAQAFPQAGKPETILEKLRIRLEQ